MSRLVLPVAAILAGALLVGCSKAYYSTMEAFGVEKREILVDRVDDARESQEEAKEQFSSALEQYRSVIAVNGGELEEVYDDLNAAFERSQERAAAVSERIEKVEQVAEDLFDEWEEEIEVYSDAGLRRESQRLLAETRTEYRDLIRAMHRAEQSMEPVLTLFQDQVLFLRHNLNARAIGALKNELNTIEQATEKLIAEMEQSIDRAGRFIESME